MKASLYQINDLCWYCHWGWAKPVAEIYLEARNRLSGDDAPLRYSASHIVWSDENFDDESVNWCLQNFNKHTSNFDSMDLAIVRRSLEDLLKIPEKIRCPCPEDYDGKNPENYLPSGEVIKIKEKEKNDRCICAC